MELKLNGEKRKCLTVLDCGVPFRVVGFSGFPSVYMKIKMLEPDKKYIINLEDGIIAGNFPYNATVEVVSGCFVEGYADNG